MFGINWLATRRPDLTSRLPRPRSGSGSCSSSSPAYAPSSSWGDLPPSNCAPAMPSESLLPLHRKGNAMTFGIRISA
eukprot:866144-Rhodomonas_salina.4